MPIGGLGGIGRGFPVRVNSNEEQNRGLGGSFGVGSTSFGKGSFSAQATEGSGGGGVRGFGSFSGRGFGSFSGESFGGNRGTSSDSGCRKCGEDGHFARECPKAGGGGSGRGGRACHKCGEEGHMARECTQSGGRGCYKCGKQGHMAKDCQEETTSAFGSASGFGEGRGGGQRGFGEGSRKGFGEGREGEMGFGQRGFVVGSRKGFGEGREGEKGFGESRDGGSSRGAQGGEGCRRCGKDGHFARDCTEEAKCYNCGESGHQKRECTNAAKAQPRTSGSEDTGERKPVVYVPETLDVDKLFSEQIEVGQNFEGYFEASVTVTGYDDKGSRPKISFDEVQLTDLLRENVKRMNYMKPTPIQQYALPVILKGCDMMACAQTGSGKTAAFLLPILCRILKDEGLLTTTFSAVQSPNAIIVSPTRELAMQIANEGRKFANGTMAKPVVCYGGVCVQFQLEELRRGCNILIGTPGRLLDFIGKKHVSLDRVQYLVLDEADRMLDMGFEPAVRKLVGAEGMADKKRRQTLMFSATFPEEIQQLAKEFLKDNYVFVVVGRLGGANTDITQEIKQVSKGSKVDELKEALKKDMGDLSQDGRFCKKTLVFVEMKRTADFVASMLCMESYPTTSIHGDREQKQREEALRDFKNGKCPVLIATSVAARGLDISGVDHVVNYDLPASVDDYVHRIGRTGRVGNPGFATSFYDDAVDGRIAKDLVKILAEADQIVPQWLQNEVNGVVEDVSVAPGRIGSRGRKPAISDDDW